MHKAKAYFAKLMDRVAKGASFANAKAGKRLASVPAVDAPARHQRIGFLAGVYKTPADFDEIGREEILLTFNGEP